MKFPLISGNSIIGTKFYSAYFFKNFFHVPIMSIYIVSVSKHLFPIIICKHWNLHVPIISREKTNCSFYFFNHVPFSGMFYNRFFFFKKLLFVFLLRVDNFATLVLTTRTIDFSFELEIVALYMPDIIFFTSLMNDECSFHKTITFIKNK